MISQTDDPKNPIVLIADDEKKKKHNLMLEKNISILQIVWIQWAEESYLRKIICIRKGNASA
ncbi:MAG: hypothetical protein ACLR78_01315 [Roseburia sp.]